MIEIKVQCDCGQRYKFDVEPVQRQMPFAVQCPVCGADGTEKANAILAARLPEPPAIPIVRLSGAAPPPPPVASAVGPSAVAPPPSAAAAAAPAISPAGPRGPAPAVAAGGARARAAQAKPAQPGNYTLGAIGAVAAGLVAMVGWYLLITLTGYEIGYAAWGVGLLTGLGARLLGRGTSPVLGITAGACALVAILGGQYLAATRLADQVISEVVNAAYAAQESAEAKINNPSRSGQANPEHSAPPTAQKMNSARPTIAPEPTMPATNHLSKAELEKTLRQATGTFEYRFAVLKASFSWMTLLWLFLGVSSAYKLAAPTKVTKP